MRSLERPAEKRASFPSQPSLIHLLKAAAAAAAAKSLQPCPNLCIPTRLPRPWDSPGNNTGVGRHCLLHLKSEAITNLVSSHSMLAQTSLTCFTCVCFPVSVNECVCKCISRAGVVKWGTGETNGAESCPCNFTAELQQAPCRGLHLGRILRMGTIQK